MRTRDLILRGVAAVCIAGFGCSSDDSASAPRIDGGPDGGLVDGSADDGAGVDDGPVGDGSDDAIVPSDAPTSDAASDAPTSDAAADAPSPEAGTLKANYGHYFATRDADTPADAAALCEQAGVTGINFRQTWYEVEPSAGVYDFSVFDEVLAAIAASSNPSCQLFLFVTFKSFPSSFVKNPCPAYLQADYSANNANGDGSGYTCFLWEPVVVDAFENMLTALAARYDSNPRVEGFIVQESALGFTGAYSQSPPDGSYTPEAYRDALIDIVQHCTSVFSTSRCIAFLNFLSGGQRYLYDISDAIAAIPNNQACFSGPDLLPDNTSLYNNDNSVYEVLTRHDGCRSNSAQNDSYAVSGCDLDCIFDFAVSGSFGDFDETAPRSSGVCVNSYLFWNHRVSTSPTGLSWRDALPVIANHPYGSGWLDRCAGGGGVP